MRFMMFVKHPETNCAPPQELMDAIVKLTEDATKSGTLIASGGLAPTAQSTCVRLSGGKVQVIDGPFAEAKEVVGGYAQFELPSKEAAIASAVEFMELHRKYWPEWEGETEIRQIFSSEDFEECVNARTAATQAG